jgi:hypothetical protein
MSERAGTLSLAFCWQCNSWSMLRASRKYRTSDHYKSERVALRAVGRNDLAEMVVHVAKVEGDGAGYDIRSYTLGGEQKFIEVKTTRGGEQTPFYVSSTEARFAAEHVHCYYLYRVFEFDRHTSSGKFFISKGDLCARFSLEPLQFKVVPANQSMPADK